VEFSTAAQPASIAAVLQAFFSNGSLLSDGLVTFRFSATDVSNSATVIEQTFAFVAVGLFSVNVSATPGNWSVTATGILSNGTVVPIRTAIVVVPAPVIGMQLVLFVTGEIFHAVARAVFSPERSLVNYTTTLIPDTETLNVTVLLRSSTDEPFLGTLDQSLTVCVCCSCASSLSVDLLPGAVPGQLVASVVLTPAVTIGATTAFEIIARDSRAVAPFVGSPFPVSLLPGAECSHCYKTILVFFSL
jgi:hypothetical protein